MTKILNSTNLRHRNIWKSLSSLFQARPRTTLLGIQHHMDKINNANAYVRLVAQHPF